MIILLSFSYYVQSFTNNKVTKKVKYPVINKSNMKQLPGSQHNLLNRNIHLFF